MSPAKRATCFLGTTRWAHVWIGRRKTGDGKRPGIALTVEYLIVSG